MIYKPTEADEKASNRFHAERAAKIEAAAKAAAASTAPMQSMMRSMEPCDVCGELVDVRADACIHCG